MADNNGKRDQTIHERADIAEKATKRLKEILKDQPVEVDGHIESLATCCRNGTVAVVKVDLDKLD